MMSNADQYRWRPRFVPRQSLVELEVSYNWKPSLSRSHYLVVDLHKRLQYYHGPLKFTV